ncbi:MAG: hypothetical protein ACRYFS_13850 [Janthinobacterium lividum]
MDIFDPIDQLLTIRARPVNAAGTSRTGVVVSTRRYLWYYLATWPDGSLAASLHIGEGIVPAGETQPWHVMRRDRIRALLQPTPRGTETIASYYPAGSGVNGEFFRLTDGTARVGGFDILGHGWRGGVGIHCESKKRCLLLRGDGDPPDVYYIEPIPRAPTQPSIAAALLLAYVLTEHEVREGNWIKRPGR